MSDNNLNNTQNQQPGYENFNQYPQGAPAQPIYIAANGTVMGNNENEEKAKKLGIWGIVLAITSCCCGITAFVGLGLSISGLKKNKNSTICIIALILNILAIVANISSAVYMQNHPEMLQQYTDMLQQMQGQQGGGQFAPAGSILRMFF